MTQYQKELKSRFEIKNLKTMQGTDGPIIDCEIYWDKKKVAHFHNDGYGGEALVYPYPIKNKYDINKSLLIFGNFEIKASISFNFSLEEIVEIKMFNKKMKGAILVGVPEKSNIFGEILPKSQYNIITFKGIRSLDKMNPENLKKHVAQIKTELKKGEIIFNTNL